MNPLVSAVVGITIVLASTVLVLNTVTPITEQAESLQKLNKAKDVLNNIDMVIKELMLEAPGAKRSLSITTELPLVVSSSLDRIFIKFDLEKPLLEPGTRIREGNVIITSGPITDIYEEDIDNDGNNDLVMENDNIIFAIKKIGSPTSYAPINTSTLISYVRNKRENIDMTPRKTMIIINENNSSSFGTGYTQIVRGATSVSVLVRVFSDSGINYTAVFTLRPKVDFVEFTVREIET